MTAKIGALIGGWNQWCEPFTWTRTADELIAKINPEVTS